MRPSTVHRLVAVLATALVVLGACGGDTTTTSADGDGPDVTTRPDDDRLPFDFGPSIGLGGDDVVITDPAVGDVDLDARFVDEIEDRPTETDAVVHRWATTDAVVGRIQSAVDEAVGEPGTEVDFAGADFSFDVGGHHEADVPETTVPSGAAGAPTDERDARLRTLRFVETAGYAPDPDGVRTYTSEDLLSVEVDLLLTGTTPVLRATASLTFDADGDVVGGYGPAGEPEVDRTVEIVDTDTAMRRLAMVTVLSGWPTTIATPPEARVIVAAEVVLSLRGVLDATGSPTGEAWLVPVYRFTDAGGGTREVLAPVATSLRVD